MSEKYFETQPPPQYQTDFKNVIGCGGVKDYLYLLEVGFVGLRNISEFKHRLMTI
jgi:hypothetical protein